GSEFQLEEDVRDVIVLATVRAKPVCLKVRIPKAEGCVFVDAAEDTFRRDRIVPAGEAGRQQGEPVAVEDRIELVERERAGTAGLSFSSIARCVSCRASTGRFVVCLPMAS